MRPDDSKFATVPVGKLGIIVHPSCAELGKRIDQYIVNWRKEREHEHKQMLSVSSALLQVSQRALLLSCRSFMRAVSIREAPESL